jgi:hypothetical protein
MSQSGSVSSTGESGKFSDTMAFASLLPILYLVLMAGAFAWFSPLKVQSIFFITAWSVAAVTILRIQQLIEHYSQGRYPYQPGFCALLLAAVVMGPWIWLSTLDFFFHALVIRHMITNSHMSWVCIFTLGATIISLLAVSPMIEGWYEILRGSFAFDGSRIKPFQPSFWAQVSLFGLFSGILLLPMIMASNHPTYALDKSDTNYIFTGFYSTFVALIWLVHQLERIREAQLSYHTSPRAPIDRSLLSRSSPLSAMLRPSHRSRPLAAAPRRHASVRRPLPLSYTAALEHDRGRES